MCEMEKQEWSRVILHFYTQFARANYRLHVQIYK